MKHRGGVGGCVVEEGEIFTSLYVGVGRPSARISEGTGNRIQYRRGGGGKKGGSEKYSLIISSGQDYGAIIGSFH